MMTMGWFCTEIDKNCPKTQPRLNPAWTSHHRNPSRQPATFTNVPAGSQLTSGKLESGPARTLTACVVTACIMPGICANDATGSRKAAATSDRQHVRNRPDPCVGIATNPAIVPNSRGSRHRLGFQLRKFLGADRAGVEKLFRVRNLVGG